MKHASKAPKCIDDGSSSQAVGALLGNQLRCKALTAFLDLISLKRLAMTNRAEKQANIASLCISFSFSERRLCEQLPAGLLTQMKESEALYCLRVTAPFKLSSFRSTQIQVLDLYACLTVTSIPLLVQIIEQQPLLKQVSHEGRAIICRRLADAHGLCRRH